MAHEFVILRKGVLETYNKYEDIPEDFDHIIKFLPEIPDGPHTDEQHEEIDGWNNKLQELLKKERNASSN
ncbi:MAG: hypothetical protein [Caudoviricetes sp.]|nr:MAG: hypothetical protein [Caudoviricetes sp.]